MHNLDRKTYEAPVIQELGELKNITQGASSLNSDTGSFPSDSNPNDAYGPIS
ncbi:lasso RiPP family leader peptide-containing protein [Halomonas salinarum]|uniref:lasso RiPP family leader peptide-containing protein n=1 Tax=Halomonas salinarum TaxID=1158993 RepID=UPI00143BE812|nr:lasso RiPP family leader peptide-containing protein [Halomonas salinarum]